MRHIDFYTACVIYFIGHVCIALLLVVAFSDSRARGARLWIAGLVAQVLAVSLFALRGQAPYLLTVVLANAGYCLALICFWASFDVFFGNQRRMWLYGLPLALATGVSAAYPDAVKPRVLMMSLLFAALTWNTAWVVLRRRRDCKRQVIAILGGGYVLGGCSFLVRGLSVWSSPLADPQPFAPGPAQDVAMLLSVPSLMACTLGFVLLHRDRAEREIRQLADSDPLTGLLNRRGFETAFARELREAADTRAWTSLALLDIDHFKAVNDRYGHALGDAVLRRLASIIAHEIRSADLVARIGGDEFCILLSGTSPERAAAVGERLRLAVAGFDWRSQGLDAPLTVTIGLSSRQSGVDDDGADYLRLADMALLAAKSMARDSVLHADALVRPPVRAGA